MPLKIGLTGGIGSGKSTVAKIFELLGVPVYYADDASKRLYKTDQDVITKLKTHFSDDIYTAGELNRSRLAAIVFNNPEKLQLLNSIVHPPTIKAANEWMAQQSAHYVIKEAALLFESGSVAELDYVIGVFAPQHIRIHRVMKRDSVSREDVAARMARQIDEEIKMRLCDFVLHNNETTLLLPQVLQLHKKFIAMATAG